MPDLYAINMHLQERLEEDWREEVRAPEAARWLDRAGLLRRLSGIDDPAQSPQSFAGPPAPPALLAASAALTATARRKAGAERALGVRRARAGGVTERRGDRRRGRCLRACEVALSPKVALGVSVREANATLRVDLMPDSKSSADWVDHFNEICARHSSMIAGTLKTWVCAAAQAAWPID